MTGWKVLSQKKPEESGKNYKIPQSRSQVTTEIRTRHLPNKNVYLHLTPVCSVLVDSRKMFNRITL
jgi:hypothetical protein